MKIHIILNSHLDPVWLWTWPQGLDEVLATARTACDLLDDYPEIFLTRGEAWFYSMVQEHDPRLFQRLEKHVLSGRLQVVGGWWIQPDCNLPTAASFYRQGVVGQNYFQDNFGFKPTVGYNVDSFGHAATLPDFYSAAKIDSYIMMRPQKHEMQLPGNLFVWRSPGSKELVTFRISRSYCTRGTEDIIQNIEETLADSDQDIGHTMCFVGIGDHGGGPARSEIEWLLEHLSYRPNVELLFSYPRAFFDAVQKKRKKLPVVKGELQHHAIGCYSVLHTIKQEVRRTEELAQQAENMLISKRAEFSPSVRRALDEAWKHILFNQFHDILAGTSIRSSYEYFRDELGVSKNVFRNIIIRTIRQMQKKLEPAENQQLLFVNTSVKPFNGYIEFEPWIGYLGEQKAKDIKWRLEHMDGSTLPAQKCKPESGSSILRLSAKLKIPAESSQVVRIKHDCPQRIKTKIKITPQFQSNKRLDVTLKDTGVNSIKYAGFEYLKKTIETVVIDDPSDTWSHDLTGYGIETTGIFRGMANWHILANGPLFAANGVEMKWGNNNLYWESRLYYGEDILRLKLRVNWSGFRQIVKLIIKPAFNVKKRVDGIPGGKLERPLDGKEYPIHNFIAISGHNISMAVVSRDIFAADVQPDGSIRLTLLRSPYFAHHDPFIIEQGCNHPVCDQGIHEYEISIMPMKKLLLKSIAMESLRQSQPIWFSETTIGCKRKLL